MLGPGGARDARALRGQPQPGSRGMLLACCSNLEGSSSGMTSDNVNLSQRGSI